MQLSDFDYKLPNDLIAQSPTKFRDQSRLMIVDRSSGSIQIDTFKNIANYLITKPAMIFNNTQVIPTKLVAYHPDYENPFEIQLIKENSPGKWEALIKGIAKIKIGTCLTFKEDTLTAILENKLNGRALIKFNYSGSLKAIFKRIALTPLPPYIKRNPKIDVAVKEIDRSRYQTIFANKPGAIAAPTAGLHFTKELLGSLNKKRIETLFLTLNIGIGTFQPIRTAIIENHQMEPENYNIPKNVWNRLVQIKKEGKPILAVGTTSVRTLESVQLDLHSKNNISGWTELFITPGYRFKKVNHLLTNFHLPKSSLFMLACAFGGIELIQYAYKIAVAKNFRFYSYGDAMLIL